MKSPIVLKRAVRVPSSEAVYIMMQLCARRTKLCVIS